MGIVYSILDWTSQNSFYLETNGISLFLSVDMPSVPLSVFGHARKCALSSINRQARQPETAGAVEVQDELQKVSSATDPT